MALNFVERAKEYLRGRSGSYRRVFDNNNLDAQAVLADLAKFCRAHKSTAHVDPQMAARLDGRREVWLRIQQHTNLSTDELWALYGTRVSQPLKD